MQEIWKDVKGYEGRYRISNTGKVLSLHYMRCGGERILIPKVNNTGRLWVQLWNGKTGKAEQIHRLVAKHFVDGYADGLVVNHKDENPKNNNCENLEWVTQKENRQYSLNLHPERKRKKPKPIISEEKVKVKERRKRNVNQFDKNGNLIKTWETVNQVFRVNGWSDWSIYQCCEGKRKTAYGFKWQYAV